MQGSAMLGDMLCAGKYGGSGKKCVGANNP